MVVCLVLERFFIAKTKSINFSQKTYFSTPKSITVRSEQKTLHITLTHKKHQLDPNFYFLSTT